MKKSAGVAVVYNDLVLSIHPTKARWYGTYGIPKGGFEKNETPNDAAIREYYEEVGIKLDPNKITGNPSYIDYASGKRIYYFIYKIENLSDIGLDTEIVPKNQLQLDEVDWAGFIDYNEAKKRYHSTQLIIFRNAVGIEKDPPLIMKFNDFIK